MFAVAAYTSDGQLLSQAIGATSKAFRTAFSLPLLFAWGYCCQVSGEFTLKGFCYAGSSKEEFTLKSLFLLSLVCICGGSRVCCHGSQ